VRIEIDRASEFNEIRNLSNISHNDEFIYTPNPTSFIKLPDTNVCHFGNLITTHQMTINPLTNSSYATVTIGDRTFVEVIGFNEILNYNPQNYYIFDLTYEVPSGIAGEIGDNRFDAPAISLEIQPLNNNLRSISLDNIVPTTPIIQNLYVTSPERQKFTKILNGYNEPRRASRDFLTRSGLGKYRLDPETQNFGVYFRGYTSFG